MRNRLVETLRQKGIKNELVLKAIGTVPRHLFMDSGFLVHAYEDKAFPIGADQTISQPYTVARQTELLDVKEGDKVLEIGTGSGYQAAILLELGVELYTIDRKSTRLNSSHVAISYAVFCLKKKQIHFFRGIGLWLENFEYKNEFELTEHPQFEPRGAMLDASRNAVLTQEGIQYFLRQMAAT